MINMDLEQYVKQHLPIALNSIMESERDENTSGRISIFVRFQISDNRARFWSRFIQNLC